MEFLVAVTLNSGVEQSTDNTTNNPRDVVANVFELEPNVAPLLAITSKTNSAPARNPKIEWLEDESMPRITTLSASAASNATAFGVTADIFRVGDVIRNTVKGWGILVTATAAGAISGSAIGNTAQTTATSGDELYLVSNANTEAATLREIKYPQLVAASNYCEIVRTPFGVTETEKATDHYGGDEELRLKAKFGREHARSLEQIAFFGLRDLKATNQRMAGGLLEFISTNSTGAGGSLTEATFQSFLKSGFRYGSERKALFCSPTVIQAVEGFARANLKVNDNRASDYGVVMKTYYSGQGIVDLIMHRDWNDSATYGGYAVLVDMDAFKYRPLRDTKLLMNRQAPDYDGLKHEYLTECSFQIVHERRHAKLTGVTG
jgi:hypothetical protein